MTFVIDQNSIACQALDFYNTADSGVICIRWPTASGKTSLSLTIARYLQSQNMVCEIISADSRQLYCGMDIGTDKISTQMRSQITHHQIDIVTPDQVYTSGQWKHDTKQLIVDICSRGHYPLIVWGTGLYIDTIYYNFTLPSVKPDRDYRRHLEKIESDSPGVLHQMLTQIDPIDAQLHHPHSIRFIIRSLEIYHQTGQIKSSLFTPQNLEYPLMMIWLMPSALYSNTLIDIRVDQMIAEWLIAEVQWLLNQWYTRDCIALNGIAYTEVIDYISWLTTLKECIRLIKQHTHQYAKKQRTWMRKYIRDSNENPRAGVQYIITQQ